LPCFSHELVQCIQRLPGLENFKPVEQCHLEYTEDRKSGIDSHIDDPWIWGEHLVTVNLLADTILSFQPPPNHPKGNAFEVCVFLPRHSLVIVESTARYDWMHAIRREDIVQRRIAVTLRELGPDFLADGCDEEIGRKMVEIAFGFNGEPSVIGFDGKGY